MSGDERFLRPPARPESLVPTARNTKPEEATPEKPLEVPPVPPNPTDAFLRGDTTPQPAVLTSEASILPGMVVPSERQRSRSRNRTDRRKKRLSKVSRPKTFGYAAAAGFVLTLLFGVLFPMVYWGGVIVGFVITYTVFTLLAWLYLAKAFSQREEMRPTEEQLAVPVEKSWDTPASVIYNFRHNMASRRRTTDDGKEVMEHDNIIECITRRHKIVLWKRLVGPIVVASILLVIIVLTIVTLMVLDMRLTGLGLAIYWRIMVIAYLGVALTITLRTEAWRHNLFVINRDMVRITRVAPAWAWFMTSDDQPFVRSVIKTADRRVVASGKALDYGTLMLGTLLQGKEDIKVEHIDYLPHIKEIHAIVQARFT